MRSISTLLVVSLLFLPGAVTAGSPQDWYNFMTRLSGDWALADATRQEGKATLNKVVVPLVGTGKTAMSFKVIGKGSTVQENLLPGTGKEMATMYHCDKFANCKEVRASHYCAKRNQPQFVLASAGEAAISFRCDSKNEVCRSSEGHVHQIQHEISPDGKNLKTTYTIYEQGRRKSDSIYHFVRK